MNIAELRVAGSNSALQKLRNSLSLKIDAEWKKGEPMRGSGEYETAGFNACVADTENSKLLLIEIRKFLALCISSDLVPPDPDIKAQLDIGIGVGTSGQFTSSITFTPVELQYFSELGFELCISAYPVSDVENEST